VKGGILECMGGAGGDGKSKQCEGPLWSGAVEATAAQQRGCNASATAASLWEQGEKEQQLLSNMHAHSLRQ